MSIYAISDIHGCAKTFAAMLETISLTKEDKLFLLGDYVDRGPASKQVIDKILSLKNEGYNIMTLTGNHEQMMLDKENDFFWFRNGGIQTLESFAVDGVAPSGINKIDKQYIDFLKGLEPYKEFENFIFVHAGLNFDPIAHGASPFSDIDSMIWIRKWTDSINYEWLGSRIIVHGHTPQTRKEIEERFSELSEWQALNIDNGCCFENEGYNHLCCVDLTKMQLHFQKNID